MLERLHHRHQRLARAEQPDERLVRLFRPRIAGRGRLLEPVERAAPEAHPVARGGLRGAQDRASGRRDPRRPVTSSSPSRSTSPRPSSRSPPPPRPLGPARHDRTRAQLSSPTHATARAAPRDLGHQLVGVDAGPAARATSSWYCSSSRSVVRRATRCSSTRTVSSTSAAGWRDRRAARSPAWRRPSACSTRRSRSPPLPCLRSGSSRWATSPSFRGAPG